MSSIKKPILLDETGKALVSELRAQNNILGLMLGSDLPHETWADIATIVQAGLASKVFKIGDQLTVSYNTPLEGTEATMTFDVVHFDDVTLEDGSQVPGMYLQAHNTIPYDYVYFDPEETAEVSDGVAESGLYYYVYVGQGMCNLLIEGTDYVIGESIASIKSKFSYNPIYKNEIYDVSGNICQWGYSRWSHSQVRQLLNSDATNRDWWEPMHIGDTQNTRAQMYTRPLCSILDKDFVSCIKPIKIGTQVLDQSGSVTGYDYTYDRFFLPSLAQMNFVDHTDGIEGKPFAYWQEATGSSSPISLGTTNDAYNFVDGSGAAKIIALRSVASSYVETAFGSVVYSQICKLGDSRGGVTTPSGVSAFTPVCVIC
jgi:hypothetical protein